MANKPNKHLVVLHRIADRLEDLPLDSATDTEKRIGDILCTAKIVEKKTRHIDDGPLFCIVDEIEHNRILREGRKQ